MYCIPFKFTVKLLCLKLYHHKSWLILFSWSVVQSLSWYTNTSKHNFDNMKIIQPISKLSLLGVTSYCFCSRINPVLFFLIIYLLQEHKLSAREFTTNLWNSKNDNLDQIFEGLSESKFPGQQLNSRLENKKNMNHIVGW